MSTRIVILAGGKSTRMQGAIKVLLEIEEKPMILHLLQAVRESGLDSRPVIVVGPHNEQELRAALGSGYEYAVQMEQHGTGHAVRAAEAALAGKADTVIVLYGDQPFVTAATIRKLHDAHARSGAVLTMMTTEVPAYEGWHAILYDFGRVIRDEDGTIVDIIERKDASPEELDIKEVNPSFFCFNAEWLWASLPQLKNRNAQGEYYLTDLVRLAVEEGHPVGSVAIEPRECIGVNTPEQLRIAQGLFS